MAATGTLFASGTAYVALMLGAGVAYLLAALLFLIYTVITDCTIEYIQDAPITTSPSA